MRNDSINSDRGKSPATVRCAIYTRKSTEEGLDQEFNSLHAQREAAEAYIKSQKQLGWTLVANQYNDGASAAAASIGRPCKSCSKTLKPAAWIAWLCIRLTG
jgi:hypothetical protein